VFDTYKEAAAQQARSGATAADPTATPLAEARAQQDRYFQTLNVDPPRPAASRDFCIPGPHGDIPIRLVYPRTGAALPCIVFVRGSGFWAGGIDSHLQTIHTLAELSGCAVCAVDYRRTPEHAYPVQRDEVLATLRWLEQEGERQGLARTPPVLFGESAGATISLTAALALRDRGARMPSGMVLFYNNGAGAKPTSRPYSQWVWRQYVGANDPQAVPGPTPLLQDMRGVPPAWIACGEDDPLMPDTELLAEKLSAAGVPHVMHRYPGMPHGFVMLSGLLKPAHAALTEAAAAARAFLCA
jgi:acetyl esterase